MLRIGSRPRHVLAVVTALTLTLLLGACASGPPLLRTQVTAYNQWSALPADKTYVFERTPEFRGSLEMQVYEGMVRDELTALGFREAREPAGARLSVTLQPSIASRNVAVREVSDPPLWGPWWYRQPWPVYNEYSVTVYQRKLRLEIDDRTSRQRVYEGTVVSEGASDSLQRVMPYLVRGMFTSFPGNNGETRVVDVPIDPKAL